MILLVDIGNSRTKCATLSSEQLLPGKAIENSEAIDTLLGAEQKPDEVYVCCVGSDTLFEALSNWVEQQWGFPTIRLYTQRCSEKVVNGYTQPELLGVDRWAALVGAYQLVMGAALVIDCGTACTADLINSDGQHCGGAIMPGRTLLQRSLHKGTAAITGDSEKRIALDWGTDTAGCIAFGGEAALLGFIEKMLQHAEKTLGKPFEIVLTGGDAATLREQLGCDVRYEKELVFYGMAAMVAERG